MLQVFICFVNLKNFKLLCWLYFFLFFYSIDLADLNTLFHLGFPWSLSQENNTIVAFPEIWSSGTNPQ